MEGFNTVMLLEPILMTFILIILMIIMITVYLKLRIFLLILVIFLFSLIIGMVSIAEFSIPFSPYFQILFILFQSSIFLLTSLKLYKFVKN